MSDIMEFLNIILSFLGTIPESSLAYLPDEFESEQHSLNHA